MKRLLILLILTLFMAGCSKLCIPCSVDDPDCFYFVCKVDGEKWVPSCEGDGLLGCYATDVQYYRYTGTNNLYIHIKNDNANSAIKLEGNGIAITDSIYLLGSKGISTFYVDRGNSTLCSTYKIDTTKNNYILLNEIDTVNYIIGGEFEFVGQDSCGKVVNITEGNFRLRYRF